MKKEGKISVRTMLSIFLVVMILLVSVGLSVGFQLRKVLIEKYTSFAFSYVNATASYVDGDAVMRYYETGIKDDYYEKVQEYLALTAKSSGGSVSILYFYVFVPVDSEEYVYIWDYEGDDEPCDLLETYPYSEGAREQARKMANKEIQGNSKYFKDPELGTDILTVATPITNSKGDVVAVAAADMSVTGINESISRILLSIISSVAGIMIVTMVIYFFTIRRNVIIPITKLHDATQKMVDNIESGDEFSIDIHTNDEIEMLAKSFEDMNGRLKDYIAQNAAITAEKERIGAELELATKIQADMLPNIFPAFPDRSEFDIYAKMTPAKEVGGDFYDFFLIDETHLGIVMADVSGKGVPAALFMMMSKILIQNQSLTGKSPKNVLEAVNAQICSNNREEMFVTVWLGILDVETGILTASNAGHENPIVRQPDGDFEVFTDKHGFVIGGMDGMRYTDYEIQLQKGAKLFVYTDGLPEATNSDDEFYGIERTLDTLNSVKDETPEKILDEITRSVDNFVGDAAKFDDLTILCVEYKGICGDTDCQTFDADVENTTAASDFVGKKIETFPFTEKEKMLIEIAVSEIFSNVAMYAYPGKTGKAEIKVAADDAGVEITVSDTGIEYNPLEAPEPDVTLSAEERKIGGYGVYIVKKTMDGMSYKRENGKNNLSFRKNFKS